MTSLVVIFTLVCLVKFSQSAVFPTYSNDGWEVIWLDRPSYLSQIYHSHSESLLYIYGEDTLRLVTTYPNFTVEDYPAADWHQPFISLHVFHNGTDLWGIGPSFPSDYSAATYGYSLPLALVGPDLYHTLYVQELIGSTFYNIFVDDRNHNDILSYLVGWIPWQGGPNEPQQQVAFGVVRTHTNINLPYADRNFTFDPINDVLALYYNRFVPYSQHYKPHFHFQNESNFLIVVDPPTFNVITIQISGSGVPMQKTRAERFAYTGYTITSSFFHQATNLLYIGYASEGFGNGTLVSIDMGTFQVQNAVVFPGTLANPRALAIDEPTDTIYVGFNGGDAVVKLDRFLTIQGFQRVPEYLVRLEAARVGLDHVYFITNEQHAKVLRVNKSDFCPHLCPLFGFCSNGKCLCDRFFNISADGRRCELRQETGNNGSSTTDKGAAVALGVLFALTFVLAVLGWVLYWRVRKNGYNAV